MLTFVLLAVFALLQVSDIYTTHRILSQGGRELNPVLGPLFEAFGHLPVLIVFKTAVVVAAWVFLRQWPLAIAALCALYVVVVASNWRQIK